MNPLQRLLLLMTMVLCLPAPVGADERAWAELRDGPAVLIVRHAQTEPGIGDPAEFRLGDCSTQRNLSAAGRIQAAAIGRVLRERKVNVARLESSLWCRCVDTARLAFPDLTVHETATLNSFFGARDTAQEQTQALRARIAEWRGPGALVLVTHQVNISALTGRPVAMAEGIVLQPGTPAARVVGAVQF
jgi:phosphohistidine phosphatase SixA